MNAPAAEGKPEGRLLQRLMQGAVLHLLLMAVALLFKIFRLLDKRFSRAVKGYEAVYVFRTPSSSRSMIFDHGRIRTRRGDTGSPDYEILLLDPPGALKAVLENPNDLVSLVVENKINQRGNLFFLYKLGYLAGLIEARFRSLVDRLAVLRLRPSSS
jgi:hypothetical protein